MRTLSVALSPCPRICKRRSALEGNATIKFSRYTGYCKHSAGDLEESISAADGKIPQVESAIKEAKASKAQLELDLVQHKAERSPFAVHR